VRRIFALLTVAAMMALVASPVGAQEISLHEHVLSTPGTSDVELASETGKPTAVGSARLFETTYVLPQLRLFALEEAGWLTAFKLEEYAPRRSSDSMALQEVLFPYLDAL
jgi:hypothetical protein